MTKLYLVRHGENLANLTKEFSYQKVDYSLTSRGVLQAEQTALYFRDKIIDAVYSSPLKRALETAQVIAAELGLPVIPMENFREINVGDIEGHSTEENWRLYFSIVREWENNNLEASFPGGENYLALLERAKQGIQAIVHAHPDDTVILVAHGGIFVATIRYMCDANNIPGEEYQNCAISEVEVVEEGGELRGNILGWAACEHLSGEAARLTSGVPDNVR